MPARNPFTAPCSGLLMFALLSAPGHIGERLFAFSLPPNPPSVTVPALCRGPLRHPVRVHLPQQRRQPRCGYR
ncbi:hypothetical protein [Nocardiopsis oceani]